MPYVIGGATRRGRRRRRSNPWVYRESARRVPVAAARAYNLLKKRGKAPKKGVQFISAAEYKRRGGHFKSATSRAAFRLKAHRRGVSSARLARVMRLGHGKTKSRGRRPRGKGYKKFYRGSRKRSRKGRKSVSKSKKRSAAARKAARTRARNKAARSRAAKKAARRRGRRGGRKARGTRRGRGRARGIRRTKIRGTFARVRGRRGRSKLVFILPKSKRAAFKRLRGRRKFGSLIRFNPGETPRGFLGLVKSAFSFNTLKVVGVGLVGLSVGVGASEAASRLVVGDAPTDAKLKDVLVGVGGGVLVTSATAYLVGKKYPKAAQILFWLGLVGTAARALATAFPGKTGLDMPRSAADADKLAVKLHAAEAQKALSAAASVGGPAGSLLAGALGSLKKVAGVDDADGYADVNDWLGQGAQGVDGWLDIKANPAGADAGHPLVGGGQNW